MKEARDYTFEEFRIALHSVAVIGSADSLVAVMRRAFEDLHDSLEDLKCYYTPTVTDDYLRGIAETFAMRLSGITLLEDQLVSNFFSDLCALVSTFRLESRMDEIVHAIYDAREKIRKETSEEV